jgi:chorismate mutase
MDINDLRAQIDAADAQLLDDFVRRMDISSQIAAYKNENSLPLARRTGCRGR